MTCCFLGPRRGSLHHEAETLAPTLPLPCCNLVVNLAVILPSFFLNPYRKLTVIIGRTLVVTLRLFLWVTTGLFLPWFFRGSSVAFRLLIRSAAPLFYGCCICCIFAASSPLQPLFYRRPFCLILASWGASSIGGGLCGFGAGSWAASCRNGHGLFMGVKYVKFAKCPAR